MSKDNILIISLGRSPAVIPETLDALLEEGIFIKKTYIVTTADEIILQKCIPLVIEDFKQHYEIKNMILRPYECILSNEDIYSQEDNLELMAKVSYILKQEKGHNIYLSMAGGRKTMSVAMALLAQIYNARAITHILVPTEIESKGNIFTLEELSTQDKEKVLHPSEKRLIFFPVLGISWMIDDMIHALRGEMNKEIRANVKDILIQNNLLNNQNKPTSLGKNLLKLLNDIEKYPEPSFKNPIDKVHFVEDHHRPKNSKNFIKKLSYNSYIKEIFEVRLTNSSETRIISTDNDGVIHCQYSDGRLCIEMRLITTAKTKGETEIVKKIIKPFFKN